MTTERSFRFRTGRPPPRGRRARALLAIALAAALAACLRGGSASAGEEDGKGRFVRSHWYERGMENGNPDFNTRFRVNAPEAVLDPRFAKRPEVRGNGMMLILMEEDLARLAGAELYLEIWGGHPGTAAKRLTVNGRSTYPLPRNGTEEGHATHLYPTVPLKITDLVNGWNAIQFACDQGSSFWGHFIVDGACLRAVLAAGHPAIAAAAPAGFAAAVAARPDAAGGERIRLELEAPGEALPRIAAVDFIGLHDGHDENGDGKTRDWHGFTKKRLPESIIGRVEAAPFALDWDVSMIPAQEDVAVRAVVHWKEDPRLSYETPAARGLMVRPRRASRVAIHRSGDLPRPFWSRAGEKMACTIAVDVDPALVERAELHVVVWDGGRGGVEHPFTLNGHPLPVAGDGRHDVLHRRIAVDPGILVRGANRIEVLSDTEHHGIEVLLPGPALVVRSRVERIR